MDLQLTGKTALVTGSTGGIGEAIARTLAREGANVVVHGRREAEARRVVQAIQDEGGHAASALGDLGSDTGAVEVAHAALAAFGGIDIVVNNVGRADEDAWNAPDPAQWDATYNTNVLSAVRMIGLLLPPMRERGWGRFIQIASMAAHAPQPHYAAYGASKAALLNLTVSLAQSLAGTEITANAVSPGVVLSAEIREWMGQMAESRGWGDDLREIERQFTARFMPNLVGHLGRAEEIADLVAFLASPRAGYLTGAHVAADGGHGAPPLPD